MMKKTIRAFSLVLTFAVAWSIGHAQVNELWKKNIAGNLLWQQVNSYGNYFVCTNTELAAYNPESGERLWSNSKFANITNDQIEEMGSSPLIAINKNGNISMLDPFSGEVKFSAAQAGVANLTTKQVLYKANGILVAGKTAAGDPVMLMVDMATGKTVWKIKEKFGRIINVSELSEEELLVVTLFKNYKLNSKTGKIIWENSTSKETEQLESLGKFGSLMKGFAEQVVANDDFLVNFYQHPSEAVFIVGSEAESGSGQGAVSYSNSYTAFNLSDGSRIWDKPVQMRGKMGAFTFYQNGFIVLPNDGGRTKINFFDLKTATGKWGKKGKGIPIKGGIYKHLKTGKGILLMSKSGEKNFLNFLDPEQGLITFEKPVKIDGEVVRTMESDKGILFVTTKEINILNPATGQLVFGKPVQTNPSLVQQKENTIYAFDTKENVVKMIDINAATVKNISNTALKFEGKESPDKLELREKGIFISSEQNVAMFDYSGSLLFQKYYAAPREPGLKRFLLYAQAVRAAYIGASSYYAAGAFQSAAPQVQEEDVVSGAIVEGLGATYEELGNAASDFAKKTFQQANARFKATAEGRDFMIVFGKIEKDNALLKINKDTGEIDGSINLGREKDPKYAVDDVTGQIFQKTADTEVTSYKF